MICGAMSAATLAMASSPLPATGWGRRMRGTDGMPVAAATKSPCGQNASVTSAMDEMPARAVVMLSRTVPDVQLPQWPYAAITAPHSELMSLSIDSLTTDEASPLS